MQTLQDSLSGDSKTLMLVNVNPTEADAGESACSLGFAARVRGVELGPAKKQIEAGAEVQELRSQLEAMQRQVRKLTQARCTVQTSYLDIQCSGNLRMAQGFRGSPLQYMFL